MGLAACGSGSPLLPPNATPEQVVEAYVAAIDADDEDAARPLMTERFRERLEGAVDGWLGGRSYSVRDLRLRARQSADGSPDSKTTYIPVTFRSRYPNNDGEQLVTWGFVLARHQGGWRISDEGVG